MEEYREYFSRQLTKYLEEKEMTFSDLANRLGVNKSVVSSWKSGARYPRMNTMQRVAEILSCEISDLIQIKNDDAPAAPLPNSNNPLPKDSDTLSQDESLVLSKYRRLSPDGKEYIHDQLNFRLDKEAADDKKETHTA